jgi:hypothetical protein
MRRCRPRVTRWSGWLDPAEPKRRQIELVDKDVDHANGILLADPVV